MLEWLRDETELYLVLRRAPCVVGTSYAKERLWLLNLLDGRTVWWSMFHPNEQDLRVAHVARHA